MLCYGKTSNKPGSTLYGPSGPSKTQGPQFGRTVDPWDFNHILDKHVVPEPNCQQGYQVDIPELKDLPRQHIPVRRNQCQSMMYANVMKVVSR